MRTLDEGHLVIAIALSFLVSVASVFWLHQAGGYEPLIASLTGIAALVGTSFSMFNYAKKGACLTEFRASALTPDSRLLRRLMEGAVETVCRGVSVPQTPESAALSAFIFKKENKELICTHYWAPNPRKEQVGLLRFEISEEIAKRVAVVEAAITKEPTRTSVSPLPENTPGVFGEIDSINFVLAAPILNADKSVWGVVDIDSGNDIGKALLTTEVSDTVMHNLASHIRLLFSLSESDGTDSNQQGIPAKLTKESLFAAR